MYGLLLGFKLWNLYVLSHSRIRSMMSNASNAFCILAADNMYSYGPSQNDLSLPPLDDYSHGPVTIPLSCFPFGVQRQFSVYVRVHELPHIHNYFRNHFFLQISTNGYISFDRAFASPYPTRFPGFTYTSLVAPFWSDVDIRRDGKVFYNVYMKTTSSYIERATHDVRQFSRFDSFTAHWVLVVTWDRVPNYPDGSGSYSDSLSTKVKCLYFYKNVGLYR